ncbi:MAG: tRNA preQ1(34) S-adenosylmethionine ribosyltransferase-isomerase QueA [Thermoplasmata archaeon]|nr:MAG: tRNA preQ1(34) S-adenosylmethionine ribosyltransferase-isomerase QueA [Thermoplasmata archaeon]
MLISEFDYNLPKEAIAQKPIVPRDACKLMVIKNGSIYHHFFYEIGEYLMKGDILVLNNTYVRKTKLHGKKETGGKVEILVLGEKSEGYECLIKGKVKEGRKIYVKGVEAVVKRKEGGKCILEMPLEMDEIEKIGEMPLPPYIKEKIDRKTAELYQTVFAKKKGSVASPTAGLHFTASLLKKLRKKGVEIVFLTLHVGIGTFMPIKCDEIEKHKMESEYYEIGKNEARKINEAKDDGKAIIAVGTTVVKALESAAKNGYVYPFSGWSDLFIYPGYVFQSPITGILTNFHLPKSTPLLLVSSFVSKEKIMEAYQVALKKGYRFLSFGDAMLILDKNV